MTNVDRVSGEMQLLLSPSSSKLRVSSVPIERDEESGQLISPNQPNNVKFYLLVQVFLGLLLLATILSVSWTGSHHRSKYKGMVVTEHPVCTDIAADILKEGGNAVDASIASTICLGVVNPCSSGIGGGAYILIRLPNGTVDFIDGREVAPTTQGSMPLMAGGTVGIPGELRALELAHAKYAKRSWSSLFQPSIRLARQGFPISRYLAQVIQDETQTIHRMPHLKTLLSKKNGALLKQGDILKRPTLADTLTMIADRGAQALYEGELAQDIVETVNSHGGHVSMDDMILYRAVTREPLTVSYENHKQERFTLVTSPGATGGPSVIFMLHVLEHMANKRDSSPTPLELHRLIESMKFTFGQRLNMGEEEHLFIDNMIHPNTTAHYSSLILDNMTFPSDHYTKTTQVKSTEKEGTMHLSILDPQGMTVSLTSTVNLRFGAGLVTPSGIVLNNELVDFYERAEGPNIFKANRRPLSSASPVILLKDQRVHVVMGGAGGPRIAPSVAQALYWILEYDLPMDVAIRQSRVFHMLSPDILVVEPGLSDQTLDELLSRGHRIGILQPPHLLSVLQGIKWDHADRYHGYSDHRKGGKSQGIS